MTGHFKKSFNFESILLRFAGRNFRNTVCSNYPISSTIQDVFLRLEIQCNYTIKSEALPLTAIIQVLSQRYLRVINMNQSRGILRKVHMNVMTDNHDHYKSESDASSGSKASTKSSTSVSFESITIREYAVTIGDNPSCSSGAPIR